MIAGIEPWMLVTVSVHERIESSMYLLTLQIHNTTNE